LTSPDVIVIGDMNINIKETNFDIDTYLDNFFANGFVSFMNLYTRVTAYTKSCIDHIFVRSNDLDKYRSALVKLNITDHYAVALSVQIKDVKNDNDATTSHNLVSKINFDNLNDNLSAEDWTIVLDESDVNKAMSLFIEILQRNITRATSCSTVSAKDRKINPWMTTAILKSVRIKDKLYKRAKKHPHNEVYQGEFVKYRNVLKKTITKAKGTYYQDRMYKAKGDSRKQWQILNEITGSKKQSRKYPDKITVNGASISLNDEPKKYTNEFNTFFSNIGRNLANNIKQNYKPQCKYMPKSVNNSFFIAPVTEDEIAALINSLELGKSCGPDGISSRVVKATKLVIGPILVHLFNLSFTTGIFPQILKDTVVVPIFKKGCVNDPNNYRPIALLSVFSKLLEKAMKNRLVTYFEKNALFHCNQYGFREKCSTEDAVQNLLAKVCAALDSNNTALAVFLDLTKAFDTVDHNRLLRKLDLYGVRGLAGDWFTNYLSNRHQITRINGHVSDSALVVTGVPQGSVLGPVLFLIYINDIYNLNTHSSISSFADDTALLNTNKNKEQAYRNVEADLSLIGDWFVENLLTLNATKSNHIDFSLKKDTEPLSSNLVMHSCSFLNPLCHCPQISKTEHVKYLGVTLDYRLDWRNQVDLIVHKLRAMICKMYYLRKIISLSTLKIFYFAMCHSHLQYSVLCWGGTYRSILNPIIKLQNRIVRVMTFKKQSDHSNPIYRQLGILPVRHLFVYKTLVYFRKIKAHSTTRLITNYHTRSESNYYVLQPKVAKEKFHKCNYYLGSKFYNIVPKPIKEINEINRFQKQIFKWVISLEYDALEDLFIITC
jgi:hypothetical protein